MSTTRELEDRGWRTQNERLCFRGYEVDSRVFFEFGSDLCEEIINSIWEAIDEVSKDPLAVEFVKKLLQGEYSPLSSKLGEIIQGTGMLARVLERFVKKSPEEARVMAFELVAKARKMKVGPN